MSTSWRWRRLRAGTRASRMCTTIIAERTQPRRCRALSRDCRCSWPKEFFMRRRSVFLPAAILVAAALGSAQTPAARPVQTATAARSAQASAEGYPIDNPTVKARCGGCHRSDDRGRMSRISFRRATPENWERTIKRMVSLNHATLSPEDARTVLKYLADHQGLAPEELRPIAFEPERRTIDYQYKEDETTSNLCTSCHSMARVLSERRTKEEWELLIAMHRGYYPLVDNQPMNGGQGWMRSGGRGGGRGGPQAETTSDGRPPDTRHPIERVLEHLEKTLPLTTSDWSAWAAAMQPPKLAGRWALVGAQTGKGAIFGQMTITADPSAPDSFSTDIRYTVARTGEAISRTGKAVIYTGYQWRGRGNDWREVMFVE